MISVGLLAKNTRSMLWIRSELNRFNERFLIFTHTDISPLIQDLMDRRIEALVISVESFGIQDVWVLKKIRDNFPSIPLIIVAKKKISLLKIPKSLGSAMVLHEKKDIKDICGIIEKMVVGKNVYIRKSIRHSTNQLVRLEKVGKSVDVHLDNLSQTGARINLPQESLKMGDCIRLKVPLSNIKKSYILSGRVVWTRKPAGSSSSGCYSVGIEFINTKNQQIEY